MGGAGLRGSHACSCTLGQHGQGDGFSVFYCLVKRSLHAISYHQKEESLDRDDRGTL